MNDPNAVLDSCFPFVEVQKSAQVADGRELLNRVAGMTSNRGPGRTGRPRKHSGVISHPTDKALTAILFTDETEQSIPKGAVLQIRMPDDTLQSIILLHDAKITLLTTREPED